MKFLTSPRSGAKWACALLVAAALSTGCKKQDKTDESAEAASTAEAAGTAADAPKGPCDEYVTQLCAKAGEQSGTCTQMTGIKDLLSPGMCKAGVKDIDVTVAAGKALRAVCDELVQKICAEVGAETESCKMVTEQTQQFPVEQCQKMLPQLEQIVQSLKSREAANKPLTPEQQAAIAKDDAPSFGPADAKVTVVEFSDFQCPYCSRAANVVTEIKKNYSDKVRFVFRQFPLMNHPDARPASQAALAAHAQGKFWEYHDKLFANQRALDRESLEKYGKEMGVSTIGAALDDKRHDAQVASDMKLGNDVFVSGTPTMFVNGERVSNPTDYATVKEAIDKAL